MQKKIISYDFTKRTSSKVFEPKKIDNLKKILLYAKKQKKKIICKGSNLSYGDQYFNNNNIIISLIYFKKILKYDKSKGIINVQSGCKISEILSKITSDGWIMTGLPGHPEVTVGGSISSNVHGKEPTNENFFSNNIIFLKILLTNGKIIKITKKNKLFKYIVGGMGLLGIILEVSIKLKKVNSNFLKVKTVCINNFNDLRKAERLIPLHDFSYIWIDTFAKKKIRAIIELAKWKEDKKFLNEKIVNKSLNKKNVLFYIFIKLIKIFKLKNIIFKYVNFLYFFTKKFFFKSFWLITCSISSSE